MSTFEKTDHSVVATEEDAIAPEPLPIVPEEFWNGSPLPEHLIEPVNGAAAAAALPKRLGRMPFWRGRENFLEQLEAIYSSAAARAAQILSNREP